MLGTVTGLRSALLSSLELCSSLVVGDRHVPTSCRPQSLSLLPLLSLGLSLGYRQLSSDFPFAQREGLRNPCWSSHPSLSGSGSLQALCGVPPAPLVCHFPVSPGGLAGMWPYGTGRRMLAGVWLAHVSGPTTPYHHGFAAFPGRTGSLRVKSADSVSSPWHC